ncbi:MAG TPA: hypothetical protein VFF66_08025 [Brevundimonas sp.]|nr:hypothetical protein [Brevundimonas sp.]
MRAPALLALTGLALGAAACATVEPPAEVAAASPAPLPVEGYDWLLTVDDETAHLAYGAPESDDLQLGFNCRRESARVGVVAIGAEGDEPVILLESGGDTGRFPAEAEPSALHDALILTAEMAATEPVLLRFRRLGWMAQWRGGEREAYAPHPESLPRVEDFFAFCG